MDDILKVQDLHVEIKTHHGIVKAVRGVSFNLAPKETLAIVGESGCGKSISVKATMRLLPSNGRISKGSVQLEGRELTSLSEREMLKIRGSDIAMIFQDPMTSLNPTMTVGKQIVEMLKAHRKDMSAADMKKRAVELLELVGISNPEMRYKQYPHELSGGMRQRVVIAIALACDPKVLIADEPTTALDVTIQAQILKLMNELKQQTGSSILFITHDLGVIHEMADEVAVMYCGQIVEKADAYTIFHKGVYSHPYTEGLMTSIPRLNTPKGKRLEAIPGAVPNPLYLPQGCKFSPRCKYCTEKCKQAEPELVEVAPNHLVRCFYPEKAGRTEHGE